MYKFTLLAMSIIVGVFVINSVENDITLSHANQAQEKLEYQLTATQLELRDLYSKHNTQQENIISEIAILKEQLSSQQSKVNTINQKIEKNNELESLITLEKSKEMEDNVLEKINYIEFKVAELESQIQTSYSDSLFHNANKDIGTQSFKPTVTMTEQEVRWDFVDSKNTKYSFSKQSDKFIDEIIFMPSPQDTLTITLSEIGDGGIRLTQEIRDLSPFVKGSMPSVMNRLYENAQNDEKFLSEIYWIVSQFHVTSYEMQDTPKKPLDTFSKGEGDNEDLAILMADMIKSSDVGKTWEMRFIYYNSDDPSSIKKINHVALIIFSPTNSWLIDPTAETIDEAFKPRDSIRGNMFEI